MSDLISDMATKVSSGFVTSSITLVRGQAPMTANGALCGAIGGIGFNGPENITTRLTLGCCAPGDVRTIAASNENAEPAMLEDVFPGLPVAGFFAGRNVSHDPRYGYTGVRTLSA